MCDVGRDVMCQYHATKAEKTTRSSVGTNALGGDSKPAVIVCRHRCARTHGGELSLRVWAQRYPSIAMLKHTHTHTPARAQALWVDKRSHRVRTTLLCVSAVYLLCICSQVQGKQRTGLAAAASCCRRRRSGNRCCSRSASRRTATTRWQRAGAGPTILG